MRRTFLDQGNPNKYSYLKKLIFPYKTGYTKKRYGRNGDGGYILLKELFYKSKFVYSYGINDSPEHVSFDLQCSQEGKYIHMYDGSIEELPLKNPRFHFKKEFLSEGVLKKHIQENGHESEYDMVLKMDIDGSEYDVINSDIGLISNHFNQVTIEVHNLIEEYPMMWELTESSYSRKFDKEMKRVFFENLGLHYNIVHIHGNNHGARHVDLPDSLEISFLRKDYPISGIDNQRYPIEGLDFPNYNFAKDYVLDWWV